MRAEGEECAKRESVVQGEVEVDSRATTAHARTFLLRAADVEAIEDAEAVRFIRRAVGLA